VLVNDLLQIGFSPAPPSSSISASSFDLNNYTGKPVSFETAISVAFAFRGISSSSTSIQPICFSNLFPLPLTPQRGSSTSRCYSGSTCALAASNVSTIAK
jgi:hypothetical protein